MGLAGRIAVMGKIQTQPEMGQVMTAIRHRVDRRLDRLVPDGGSRLESAMRYSLLGGGKRIRPAVTMIAASNFGCDDDAALDPACVIEMVHCAALIIDDLPSMDDAQLRRGQAANHCVWGEDIATLAGIGLLNRAYGVIGAAALPAETKARLITTLADAVGAEGLVAGQEQDLRDTKDLSGVERLEELQHLKTGALFVAAAEFGAIVAGADDERLAAVREFSRLLGLAFQILDDLLDTLGEAAVIGKDVGKDEGRASFTSIMRPAEAQARAERHVAAAISAVEPFGSEGREFAALAEMVLHGHRERLGSAATMAATATING